VTGPRVTRVHGVAVARLPVDVDAANAAGLSDQLVAEMPREAPCLVLDLAETRYIDSAGIDMLLQLGESLRRSRQTLCLAVPEDAPIRRLLRLAGVESSLPLYPDVDDALAAGTEPSGSPA